MCELLAAPPGPVVSLGGGAVGSRARARRARAPHRRAARRRRRHARGSAPAARRPLARDRERFEALHAERRPLYDALADAILTDSARDAVRRAVPALAALRDAPAGTRMLWARSASGDYPVYVGDGPARRRRAGRPGAPFLVTDETVGALYGARVGEVAATLAIPPGEAAKTWDQAGRVLRGAGRRGDGARRPRGRARRRRRRRPRRLLRRDLPARRAGRAAADDARRAGRLGLRRQDRRRPARGQELRRRLPPARRRARRPGGARDAARAEELAAGWAEVVKTALIAGGPLWERVRARRAGRRRRPRRSPARARSSRSSRGTSATPAAARCSTSATRSGTRSRPRPATRATATARRSGSACSPRSTLSDQPALRAEVAALLAARGLPAELDPAVDRVTVLGALAGRQEAPRRARRLRARRGAGRRAHRTRRAGRRARRALWKSCGP